MRISIFLSYSKILMLLLFLQAVAYTCLDIASIAGLQKYDVAWQTQRGFDVSKYWIVPYSTFQFQYMNWFNIIFAFWFQFFLAIDAHIHRNTMQIIAIGIFNALGFTLFAYEFRLGETTKYCYDTLIFNIQQAYLQPNASPNVTFEWPTRCAELYAPTFNGTFSTGTAIEDLMVLENNYSLLSYANILNSVMLVLLCISVVVVGFLAFKTSRDYGWDIYEVNGADIKKRDMLFRYHVFLVLLKFNIYFAICNFVDSFYAYVVMLIFNPPAFQHLLELQKQDLVGGGYAYIILMCVLALWCLMSSVVFFLIGARAVRTRNYYLMGFMLFVYVVQIFIEGRLFLYWFNVRVPTAELVCRPYNIYMGVVICIQMVVDFSVVLSGIRVVLDFKDGLAKVVSDMHDTAPWILTKKPASMQKLKRRMTID